MQITSWDDDNYDSPSRGHKGPECKGNQRQRFIRVISTGERPETEKKIKKNNSNKSGVLLIN